MAKQINTFEKRDVIETNVEKFLEKLNRFRRYSILKWIAVSFISLDFGFCLIYSSDRGSQLSPETLCLCFGHGREVQLTCCGCQT